MTLRDDRNREARRSAIGGAIGGFVGVVVWRLADTIAFLIASAWPSH